MENSPADQSALDIACQIGRWRGGWQNAHPLSPSLSRGVAPKNMPPLPKADAPQTMEEIRLKALQDAMKKHGSINKASNVLDITRQTSYDILKNDGRSKRQRMAMKKVVQMVACIAFVFVAGCKSPRYSPPPVVVEPVKPVRTVPMPPMPMMQRRALVAIPRGTNGIVSLGWDNSPTNTTIINQTTGNAYLVATNRTITIGSLSTTPQTFIATNQFGASNPLVVVPPPNTNRFVIFVDRYGLDNIGKAGILQSSSNMVVWVDEGFIGSNQRVYVYPTNRARFYRGRY